MHEVDAYLDAFNDGYNKLYQPVFHFANKIIEDEEQSREIVIKAFCDFFEKEADFGSIKVKRKLYVTVKNDCLDFLRKQKSDQPYYEQWLIDQTKHEPPFSDEIMHAQLMEELLGMVDRLPPKYRAAVKGVHVEGISVKELAQLLKVTESTVYGNKRKGLAKLKEWIKKQNIRLWLISVWF
jgi:RNA polymerase sigma-70 factor (ECF subfamily)